MNEQLTKIYRLLLQEDISADPLLRIGCPHDGKKWLLYSYVNQVLSYTIPPPVSMHEVKMASKENKLWLREEQLKQYGTNCTGGKCGLWVACVCVCVCVCVLSRAHQTAAFGYGTLSLSTAW